MLKQESLIGIITLTNYCSVASIEYIYLFRTDWHKAAEEAAVRNAAG
jgi:hypothetical protein